MDPSTGKPITSWEQSTKLNPLAQSTLDSTMQVDRDKARLALGQMGRAEDAMSQPFDWGNLQDWGKAPDPSKGMMSSLDTASLGKMPVANAQERQRIENMMFDRMAPQHQQSQAKLETQLANMGLTRGSEAWNREMQRMGDQQSRERFNAMEVGGNEMQRLFGMQMQGRQQGWNELLGAGEFQNRAAGQGFDQGMRSSNYANALRQAQVAEQQQRRTMPLNELNALLSGTQVGQFQAPQFNPSRSAGGVDYLGAAGNQYNAGLDAYNVRQSQTQGLLSGLSGLAQMGMMFSDRRLKSNVVRVGTHPLGVGVYDYDIFGRRERGVMAQELLTVAPQFVHVHPSGFLMVNYEGL